MSKKLPYMPFYPGDWHKDPGVQCLDLYHRGMWFEMLLLMYESQERGVLLINGRPMPEQALARHLGITLEGLRGGLTHLVDVGVAHRRENDGAIFNKRMVNDEIQRQKNIENGSKGGNPAILKNKKNKEVKGGVNQGGLTVTESEIEYENEVVIVSNKKEIVPFVWLTESELSKYSNDFGPDYVKRCCEKLSAWIEQDPTPKRKKNGRNASATFRSWVFNSVSEEQAKASRLPNGNHQPKKAFNTLQTEKNLQALAQIMEESKQ